MKLVVIILLALCLCCSSSKEDDDDSGKELNPKYESLVKQFGNAIAQKDYRSAYDVTSPNLRKELSYDEFVEAWKPYIGSLEGEIETEYTASDDPKDMAEFVAEADRAHLVEEVTIEFSGMMEGEEAEFFCSTWVVDDGTPSIGSFYVED